MAFEQTLLFSFDNIILATRNGFFNTNINYGVEKQFRTIIEDKLKKYGYVIKKNGVYWDEKCKSDVSVTSVETMLTAQDAYLHSKKQYDIILNRYIESIENIISDGKENNEEKVYFNFPVNVRDDIVNDAMGLIKLKYSIYKVGKRVDSYRSPGAFGHTKMVKTKLSIRLKPKKFFCGT